MRRLVVAVTLLAAAFFVFGVAPAVADPDETANYSDQWGGPVNSHIPQSGCTIAMSLYRATPTRESADASAACTDDIYRVTGTLTLLRAKTNPVVLDTDTGADGSIDDPANFLHLSVGHECASGTWSYTARIFICAASDVNGVNCTTHTMPWIYRTC